MPNKLSQFWQELKRRKVIRVITVYAASAFVILEAVDIIFPRMGFPDWTVTFVIFLIVIGFIITVILSWVYDITPEGGVVKTEPVHKSKKEEKHASSKGWMIASYISFVVIVGLIVLNVIPRSGKKEILDRSIAVLPLRNLSIDSTQAYFCDAIREEILNHLDKIEVFTVRSRTSTDQYRNTEKSIITIGEELNVNYLIEGSIGCEANEIKIWIQLINAKTDEHVWSDELIYEKVQIFTIQDDIAKIIAKELKVKLSPEEVEKIGKTPTEDTDAYQAYMRGRYYANQPHRVRENWDRALQNFQQAVEIDTGFALAWGELAATHGLFRFLRWDLSESRLEKADQAAAKALELGPDQPEVHLSLGYYYLYAYRDIKQQRRHWEIAEKGMPDDVNIMKAVALGFKFQGRWEENIEMLKKASELSPNDANIYTELGLALYWSRRYRDADDAFNRAITLSPKEPWPYCLKAYNINTWKGPNKQSRDALEHIAKDDWYLISWYWQEVGEGNFEAVLQLMSDTSIIWGVHNKMWTIPKSMYSAFIHQYLGKNELAIESYKTAAMLLEKKVKEIPSDPRYHSSLGIAYAGLGRKEEAIKEVATAEELLPLSVDAVYGTTAAVDAAIVYTMVGEIDLAIDQLEYLLSFPNYISTVWIEWDIPFAPLKTHPKYKELIKKYPVEQ